MSPVKIEGFDEASLEGMRKQLGDMNTPWPAPKGRPTHVRLVGGPDDGMIVALRGIYMAATPAIFPNGYIGHVGRYEWFGGASGERYEWYGRFVSDD